MSNMLSAMATLLSRHTQAASVVSSGAKSDAAAWLQDLYITADLYVMPQVP